MWTLYVRDPQLVRQAQVTDFASLEAVAKFKQVGTWILTLNAQAETVSMLTQEDWGIELVDDDQVTVFSGPFHDIDRQKTANDDQITLAGYDDMICLKDRLVAPVPSGPPYTSQEYDVRTGVGSTVLRQYVDVNAGPTAVAARRTYGLTVGADPVAGSSITGRGRWQNLLDFLSERAEEAGGLGFRVAKTGAALEFQVYMPQDKSGTVVFSVDLGSMGSFKYGRSRPECTYVYVGGGGEGTARAIRESQDPVETAKWKRRIETFVDRRDTAVDAELYGEGFKTLAEGKGKTRVEFVPIEIDGVRYRIDYQLGDTVTAVLDTPMVEVIRQVTISLKPNEIRVIPSIGTPTSTAKVNTFQKISALGRRIVQLERR